MADDIRLSADPAIFYVALAEMERVDGRTVDEFLAVTPLAALTELEMQGACCVIYPSRLLLRFLAECEDLGLMD